MVQKNRNRKFNPTMLEKEIRMLKGIILKDVEELGIEVDWNKNEAEIMKDISVDFEWSHSAQFLRNQGGLYLEPMIYLYK